MVNHLKYKSTTHPFLRRPDGKLQSCPVHIRVWVLENGAVPQGCVIHHIDLDRYNNNIDNLVCWKTRKHDLYHLRLKRKARQLNS